MMAMYHSHWAQHILRKRFRNSNVSCNFPIIENNMTWCMISYRRKGECIEQKPSASTHTYSPPGWQSYVKCSFFRRDESWMILRSDYLK
jgi:hypothetical protein